MGVKRKSKNLIVITGPTAIGKTGLAVFIAEHFDTEVISCDSRQFYKEMSIGTAVPSKEELKDVKHHFIQHKSIQEDYTVGDFETDVLALLKKIFRKKDMVILTGGSSLYERAVTEGLDSFPDIDKSIREALIQELETKGIESLQTELEKADPAYFQEADIQNPHRVIRALEICRGAGKPFSSFRSKSIKERDFDILKIGLARPREEIYDRINRRVDSMMNEGLLKEAATLYPHRHLNALQTVGYRELFDYFDGNFSLEEAIEEIKKHTRHYAKRQLTWYRKAPDMNWFPPSEKEKIAEFIADYLRDKT